MKYAIQHYACGKCGYSQDFDPTDINELSRQFPELPDLPVGKCPACWGKGVTSDLGLLLDSHMETVVSSDSDLEAQLVPDLDENGDQLMEQTGEHYELRINQQTGAITSELVPDYAPKMRPLTDQELADLKLQRDQNLDDLSAVAVKEITPTPDQEQPIS